MAMYHIFYSLVNTSSISKKCDASLFATLFFSSVSPILSFKQRDPHKLLSSARLTHHCRLKATNPIHCSRRHMILLPKAPSKQLHAQWNSSTITPMSLNWSSHWDLNVLAVPLTKQRFSQFSDGNFVFAMIYTGPTQNPMGLPIVWEEQADLT